MKWKFSWPALVLAIFVTLAFGAIILRWVVVVDLAAEVDTHRLSAEEESEWLAQRAKNGRESTP
jgi:hypothetical protein